MKTQTTCGYCDYEESDGSLIEQCPRCKEIDARAVPSSEDLARQAARYRWLRENAQWHICLVGYRSPEACRVDFRSFANKNDYCDAVIDTAMRQLGETLNGG